MTAQLQHKRGTAAALYNKNPILAHGELGIEMDSGNIKIGDGVSRWRDLPVALSSAYLPKTGTAANSDMLDGLHASEFLRSGGRAADSELFDGFDSSAFFMDADALIEQDRVNSLILPGGANRSLRMHHGTGTAFPTANVKEGDTYRHTGLGGLLMNKGVDVWRQIELPSPADAAGRNAISTNYANLLYSGFRVRESDTGTVVEWDGARWVKIGGPATVIASAQSLGAGSALAAGATGLTLTSTLSIPAHTAGTLYLSGHVMVTGVNVCAGFIQLGVGPTSTTMVPIADRSRYHNNGGVSVWTVPCDGYVKSDGTAKVAAFLGWSDPGSGGTVTHMAASLRVYLPSN